MSLVIDSKQSGVNGATRGRHYGPRVPCCRSVFTVALLGACACGSASDERPRSEPRALEYVGRATCERCHFTEAAAWAGSDHDRAMSWPSEGLLADFTSVPGEPLAANIEYGFGFEPLQQYLVATERGRLQVLPFAWDARPEAEGGQRWFEPNPDAAQHWRGPAYNWNHACAECHSTGVHEGYDADHNVFRTTFAEPDVSCESCHGRGSEHVRWASRDRTRAIPNYGFEFELRGASLGAWRFLPGKATAERIADAPLANELDVCARCHSRRSQIYEDHPRGASLLDTHVPALIEPPLYFDDGQIREEVYEYGSFLQSKMHGAGVTCSDCHEPHGTRLRAPGNACVDAVTLHRHSTRPRITIMRRAASGLAAWSVTCPRECTWASTHAATTACVCRGRISASRWVCPTLAKVATRRSARSSWRCNSRAGESRPVGTLAKCSRGPVPAIQRWATSCSICCSPQIPP